MSVQGQAIFLDTDGNPATGDAGGADVAVVTYGYTSGPDDRRLGTWNGSAFSFIAAPGMPFRWGGIQAPFSVLGITAPVTLTVRALALWNDPSGAQYVDFAPDGGNSDPGFKSAISFSPPPAPARGSASASASRSFFVSIGVPPVRWTGVG
jgi:hypothetical protein